MKYRIKEVDNYFYPQYRFWFMWFCFNDGNYICSCYWLQDAIDIIQKDIITKKASKPKYHEVN